MVEMLVTDDQPFDLPVPQLLVDAFLGETAIHPVRVPAGIEQQAVPSAVGGFGVQQRGKTGGVLGV